MAATIFDKRSLMGVVVQMESPTTFLKDTFFNRIATSETEKVDIDMVKGNRKVAPYVHPVKGGKVMANEGYRTESYKPPLVAPEKIMKASDLNKRLPGEDPYEQRSAEDRANQKVVEGLEEMESSITRREEQQCAQALFEGKISIVGDGINEVIDFNLENKVELVTKWSDAASDKLKDLQTIYEMVQTNGFVNPNICIMGKDVVHEFLNDEKIQKLLDCKNIELAKIEPRNLPNGARYIGRIALLDLDIYTYNGQYVDDWTDPEKPVQKYYVPTNKFVMAPSDAEYTMCYGAVEAVDEDTDSVTLVEGKRVPDSYTLRKPARKVISLSSRPLPIPTKADSWAVVTAL